MIKNIIFDFDGVIINSHDVQVKALRESYRSVCGDGEPPYEEFFLLSGDSLKNIFSKLDLPLEMLPIYQRISRENIELIKIHEGMVELLQALNDTGCNCALCTGKDRSRTIEILRHLNLEQFFKIVVCSDDVTNPKPHPESLLLIMDKLEASKHDIVMIGDGVNDIEAAGNAEIKSIAVTWGDVPAYQLAIMSPTHIVDFTDRLSKLLLEEKCFV